MALKNPKTYQTQRETSKCSNLWLCLCSGLTRAYATQFGRALGENGNLFILLSVKMTNVSVNTFAPYVRCMC